MTHDFQSRWQASPSPAIGPRSLNETWDHLLSGARNALSREVLNVPQHFCPFCKELWWNSSSFVRPASALRHSAWGGCVCCEAIVESVHVYDTLRLARTLASKLKLRCCHHKIQDPHLDIAVQMRSDSQHGDLEVTQRSYRAQVGSFNISLVFNVLNGHDPLAYRTRLLKVGITGATRLREHVDFNFISKQLHDCIRDHPNCGVSEPRFKPTRLIHVGDELTEPYLVVNLSDPATYAALSYCWGDASGTIKTTRGNLASLQDSIKIASLPQTIRDAVFVCRKVGIRYLWVDALCIIQDSEGQRDWYNEAAQLQEVYSCAIFVIAAHDSPSSTSGFLQKHCFMPKHYEFRLRNNTAYWLLNGHSGALRESVLSTRGWVLQEQLLAKRIIHFTGFEMIWECGAGLQSESESTGYLHPMDLTRLVTNPARLPEVRRDAGEERVDQNINNFLQANRIEAIYWAWRQTVTDYSRRRLTRAEDRLVALSGVAKLFASHLSVDPQDSYFAGLWKDALIQDLLWRVSSPPDAIRGAAGGTYVAPSWSWASITGAVHYFYSEYQFRFEPLAEVLEASCVQTSADPTGALLGGSLEIIGQFQPVVLEVKPCPTADCGCRSKAHAFVHEPGEEELEVFLDELLESGVYSQGYQCLVLGANVDRFSGARRTWFVVVKEKGTRESDGLRMVERTGIGFLSSTDSWLLYSDFETIIMV